MKADEARKLSEDNSKVDMTEIYRLIRDRASNTSLPPSHRTSMTIGYSKMNDNHAAVLKENKYKVEKHDDQRDGSYYSISW